MPGGGRPLGGYQASVVISSGNAPMDRASASTLTSFTRGAALPPSPAPQQTIRLWPTDLAKVFIRKPHGGPGEYLLRRGCGGRAPRNHPVVLVRFEWIPLSRRHASAMQVARLADGEYAWRHADQAHSLRPHVWGRFAVRVAWDARLPDVGSAAAGWRGVPPARPDPGRKRRARRTGDGHLHPRRP